MPVCFVQFKTKKVSFLYNKLENEYISVMNWRFYTYLDKLSDGVFNVKIKVFYLRDTKSSEMEFITKIKLQYPSQNKKIISIQNIPIEIYIDDIKYRSYEDYTIYFSMVNNKMEYVCTSCGNNKVSVSRQLESSDYIFSCKNIPCIKQFMLAGNGDGDDMDEEVELTDDEIRYRLETLKRKQDVDKALKLNQLLSDEEIAKFEIEQDYTGELSVGQLKEKNLRLFKAEAPRKSEERKIDVIQKQEYDQLEADLIKKKKNQTMLGKRKRITEPEEEKSKKKIKKTPKLSEEKTKSNLDTPKSSSGKNQKNEKDIDEDEQPTREIIEEKKEQKKGDDSYKMDVEKEKIKKKEKTEKSDNNDDDNSDSEEDSVEEDSVEEMDDKVAIANHQSSMVASTIGKTGYQLCIIPENCDASPDNALCRNKSYFLKQFNWEKEEYLDYSTGDDTKIIFNRKIRNPFLIFWPSTSHITIGENDDAEQDTATFDKDDYNVMSGIIKTLFHKDLGKYQVFRTIIMQPTQSNIDSIKTQRIPSYESISTSVPLNNLADAMNLHPKSYRMCCFLCDELIGDILNNKSEWFKNELAKGKGKGQNIYAIVMGYVKEISNYYILELIDNFLFQTEQRNPKVTPENYKHWAFDENKKRVVQINSRGENSMYELQNKQKKGIDIQDRINFENVVAYPKRRHKLFFKQQTIMNGLFKEKNNQKFNIDKSVIKVLKYILAHYAQYSSRSYKYMISTSKSYNSLVKLPIKKFSVDYGGEATEKLFKNIFKLRTSNTFWIGDSEVYTKEAAFEYTGELPPEPKKMIKKRGSKRKNKEDSSEDDS